MNLIKHSFTLIFCFLLITQTDAQDLTSRIVDWGTTFEEQDGIAVVEAEYFFRQKRTNKRQWFRTSMNENPQYWNDVDGTHCKGAGNNAYIELLPDTRATHADKMVVGENFTNKPGEVAIVDYRVGINNPGRYYVWVRAYSTGTEDNGIHVGLNGNWPESGQRMQWCEGKNDWRWESKQRTEEEHCGVPHQIYLDIEEAGEHQISFSMREDGFEFDRFLLTNDLEYVPEGIGPEVKVTKGELPAAYPAVSENPLMNKLEPKVSGELKKWHKVTMEIEGPELSESDDYNPFMNYRLNVIFTHPESGEEITIPGYFSADGNAGETSASKGSIWKVHFAPHKAGVWNYKVSFRRGKWAAVSEFATPGSSAAFLDGYTGSLSIDESDKSGRDLRSRGRLQYDGTRYLKFAETGEIFLKAGPDAPENFLAYADFDGTFKDDGQKDNLVKTWDAHLKDWNEGDPTWQNGKGKAIIGAINYLAGKGLNSFSFITMNIGGDDRNVFPYIDYETYDRFDCSKLDQWEVLFSHADKLGMFLHFKIMEAENQGLLDNGAIGANTKLLYRELIARFGHHLALNWNIGEEMGEWVDNPPTPPLYKTQRLAAAQYFFDHDPYHHHVVIHNGVSFDDILGPDSKYTGVSLQTHHRNFDLVHPHTKEWLEKSAKAGKQWAVAVDEPGDAQHSLLPDAENPDHDMARINGLWGAFMAGAWGTEWYFGYAHAHSDLSCQDFRSRDLFWDQCVHLLNFFKNNGIDLGSTRNMDELVQEGDYCLGISNELYLVFLRNGRGEITIEEGGKYELSWYNPREGGDLQNKLTKKIKAGIAFDLGKAPADQEKDWLVVLRKLEN